jgi:hypothetical protein
MNFTAQIGLFFAVMLKLDLMWETINVMGSISVKLTIMFCPFHLSAKDVSSD